MSFVRSSSRRPRATLAASRAIGKPVAFEARAEERDTRGFISITTKRPSAGSTANWTLAPPVATPTASSTVRAASRRRWYSRSVSVCAGATVIESPVWTPIGSRFSIEQTTTKVPAPSRITSSSNSFQPRTDVSTSTSCAGDASSPRRSRSTNAARLVAAPPPQPPRVNEGRRIAGRPISSTAARPSLTLCTIRAGRTGRPASSIASRNASRSSARRIERTDAPNMLTPRRSSTPASSSSTARLRAVCPPSVGIRASGRSRSSTAVTASSVSGST